METEFGGQGGTHATPAGSKRSFKKTNAWPCRALAAPNASISWEWAEKTAIRSRPFLQTSGSTLLVWRGSIRSMTPSRRTITWKTAPATWASTST